MSRHDNGGAGKAAVRLLQGLREIGHDASMLVLAKHSLDPGVLEYKPSQSVIKKLKNCF